MKIKIVIPNMKLSLRNLTRKLMLIRTKLNQFSLEVKNQTKSNSICNTCPKITQTPTNEPNARKTKTKIQRCF